MSSSKTLSLAVRAALRRLSRLICRRSDELVMVRDLLSYSPPAAAAAIRVDIQEPANPLVDITRINPDLSATADRFLKCGFRVLVCRIDGMSVGYIWLHDNAVGEPHPALDRFGIQLESNDVYLFNFYVSPEFRKGGVAAALFAGTLMRLRDCGYERAYGFVAYTNIPAPWMHYVHGYQTIYRFTGCVLANAVLMSNRGLFFSTSLLGHFNWRYRRVVKEFLPLRHRLHIAQSAVAKREAAI